MFKKQPAQDVADEDNLDHCNREAEETHELLERLAREHLPALSAAQDQWLSDYKEEYERDNAGFGFSCRRHGDFLTLEISRDNNKEESQTWFSSNHPRKLATSINLSKVREFQLKEGHGPDRCGLVGFGYRLLHGQNGGVTIGSTNFGNYKARPGEIWEVTPLCPDVPSARPLYVVEPEPENAFHNYMMSGESYSIKAHLENAARLAEDDKIKLHGMRATIYAPHGRGKEVLDAILSEIARYWERASATRI